MSAATQFPRFAQLQPKIQRLIWEYAALQTRDGPRLYCFDLYAQTYQFIERELPNGEWVHTEVRGPLLVARPELVDDTKDQRALIMACRGSLAAIFKLIPNRINFTRPHSNREAVDCFNPRIQYPLYFDADADILCLCADQVRLVYQSAQDQVFGQSWGYDRNRPMTNWPLWSEFKNIAIDISNPDVSLHPSQKAMEAALYYAIGHLLYHPASIGQGQLRLFMVNFAPVQHGQDGKPVGMTIDADMPEYMSSMIARYAGCQNGLTGPEMWLIHDEGQCVRNPDWARSLLGQPIAVGRPARLLVPSQDGQRLLCIKEVEEPEDDPDSDDDEDDGDDEDDSDDTIVEVI